MKSLTLDDIAASNLEKGEMIFDDRDHSGSLADLAVDLLHLQNRFWPDLAEAHHALEKLWCRRIDCEGFSVLVQHNPRRIVSTGSSTDPESLSRRPCFLCPPNLPMAQRALQYRKNYLVLCNPVPIFREHFTIATTAHSPQAIEDHIAEFLCLAKDMMPRFILFYNGPRCGASAPDHFHFQAVSAGILPIEQDMSRPDLRKHVWGNHGANLFRIKRLGREVWVLEGRDSQAIDAMLHRILDSMKRYMTPGDDPVDEPMMNIIGIRDEGMWKVIIFPRRKHRPTAFYREDETRLVLTPAAVEMGGLLIAPVEQDYHRIDEKMIREIYEEVSLDEETACNILNDVAGGM
jgi:hypothetical protein